MANMYFRAIILCTMFALVACVNGEQLSEQQQSAYINSVVPANTPVTNAVTNLMSQGFHCDDETLLRADEMTCSRATEGFLVNKVEWVDLIADSSRSIVVEARARPVGCYGFFCRYLNTDPASGV